MTRRNPLPTLLLAAALLIGACLPTASIANQCDSAPNMSILSVELASDTVTTTVDGSPFETVEGVVVTQVVWRGESYPIGVPLTIDPGDTYEVSLTFPDWFELQSTYTCDDMGGIVEAPDPVTVKAKKKKDHEGGGGGGGGDMVRIEIRRVPHGDG